MSEDKKSRILLIEDNPGDVMLLKEAFRQTNLDYILDVANDGEEAVNMLFRRGEHAGFCLPDIILLDLNLPKLDGREVLEKIKTDENIKTIPTIVLTSSKSQLDITQSYKSHANSYIVKPSSIDSFVEFVKSIETFWFSTISLPKN